MKPVSFISYCVLQYEGSIEENTQGVEVMRIKAEDLDLKNTDNWDAVFDIVKGNEAGYFSIRTDPKTNEGILMLDKVLLNEQRSSVSAMLIVKKYTGCVGIPVFCGINVVNAMIMIFYTKN